MINLELLRTQHGVGQGGFHTSTFCVHDSDLDVSASFEMVFDCGTVSRGPDGEVSTDFLASRIDAYVQHARVVDAFFISHMDQDHLNGAETLCSMRKVKRIFLPYFQQGELALFMAQQIVSNDRSALGPRALAAAVNALRGGTLFDVPVTLVGGPEAGGRDDALRDGSPDRIDLVEIMPSAASRPVGSTLASGAALGLQIAGCHIPWVLLPWSYKESPVGLNQLLSDVPELALIHSAADYVTAQDMEDLIDLRPRIRASLTRIIKAAGGVAASDFNAPSICLYSGPTPDDARIKSAGYVQRGTSHLWAQEDPIGWITTGDAILRKYEFEFFQAFQHLFGDIGTYVLPHHGAQKNHSREFMRQVRGRFALICAKHGSKHHPHSEVLSDLAAFGEEYRVLTQYLGLGVSEVVSMDFDC